MPNSSSAIKRMRSDVRKRDRNQVCLSELKTLDQKLLKSANDPAQAAEIAKDAVSLYDRAVTRGIIPRNRANRKKSRIAAFLASLKK